MHDPAIPWKEDRPFLSSIGTAAFFTLIDIYALIFILLPALKAFRFNESKLTRTQFFAKMFFVDEIRVNNRAYDHHFFTIPSRIYVPLINSGEKKLSHGTAATIINSRPELESQAEQV